MRALTILSIAAILVGCASAYVSQDQARALETRWKNCSVVTRGRLGALHPLVGDLPVHFSNEIDKTSAAINPKYDADVNYYGCEIHGSTDSEVLRGANPKGYFVRARNATGDTFWCDTPVDPDHIITFDMPTKVNEVATITAKYICHKGTDTLTQWVATVVSRCENTDPYLNRFWANASTGAAGSLNTLELVWTTREACARFPYSGTAVPKGGIGAIIFVVLAFVLQFGAFVKYHKSHVHVVTTDEEGIQ